MIAFRGRRGATGNSTLQAERDAAIADAAAKTTQLATANSTITTLNGQLTTANANVTTANSQRDAALAAQADAEADLAQASDLSVKIPSSWTTTTFLWDNTLGSLPNKEYSSTGTGAPGMSVVTDGGLPTLKCSVASDQQTLSSGKRAEAKWITSPYRIVAGDRTRVKYDLKLDIAGGSWPILSASLWAVIGQFHGYLQFGSPPVSLELHGDRIRVRCMPNFHDLRGDSGNDIAAGVPWSQTITSMGSTYHTFEITTQWGLDAYSSWVALKYDGVDQFGRFFTKNMLFDAADTKDGTNVVSGLNSALEVNYYNADNTPNFSNGGYAGDSSTNYFKLGLYQHASASLRTAYLRNIEVEVSKPVY